MPGRSRTDSVTVVTTGVLLLLFGYFLFLGGGVLLTSQPQTLGLWGLLIGMLIILGGILAALLAVPTARPAPVRSPLPDDEDEEEEGPPTPLDLPDPDELEAPAAPARAPRTPMVPISAGPAVQRAASLAAQVSPSPARPRVTVDASSIPATYLQAIGTVPLTKEEWAEVAPPFAAALPFSPGIRRATTGRPWDEDDPSPSADESALEAEVSRLRARVRELEPLHSVSISGATVTPRLSVPATAPGLAEPPAPPAGGAARPKGCAGCGTGLSASGPVHLCWGCGRTICPSCYWRFGPGPGLHRCPDCAQRASAPSPSISGGRATAPSAPLSPATAGPTPTVPAR